MQSCLRCRRCLRYEQKLRLGEGEHQLYKLLFTCVCTYACGTCLMMLCFFSLSLRRHMYHFIRFELQREPQEKHARDGANIFVQLHLMHRPPQLHAGSIMIYQLLYGGTRTQRRLAHHVDSYTDMHFSWQSCHRVKRQPSRHTSVRNASYSITLISRS